MMVLIRSRIRTVSRICFHLICRVLTHLFSVQTGHTTTTVTSYTTTIEDFTVIIGDVASSIANKLPISDVLPNLTLRPANGSVATYPTSQLARLSNVTVHRHRAPSHAAVITKRAMRPLMNDRLEMATSSGTTLPVEMPCQGVCGGWAGPDTTYSTPALAATRVVRQ